MTKTMKIEGMMCAHCSGRVEKALNDAAAANMGFSCPPSRGKNTPAARGMPREL